MRVNSSANPETAALVWIIKNSGGFLPLINPLKAVSNMPSPLMIGLLVFVVILAGAFAGRTVRRLLPRDDLTDETKSLVSVSMAVVTTISALVLGLLISNANNSFIALGGQVTSLSAQIIRLDQILRRYGPDTEPARAILRHYAEHKA